VTGSAISEVRDLGGAARLGCATEAALEHAITYRAEAKQAFVVAAAARFALALVGRPGTGKTQLIKHALPMIADLTDHDTMWFSTSWPSPGLLPRSESLFIRPGEIAIVPALPSVFEDQGSPTVLIFDMLDHLPNEPEVHAFAAGLKEPWRLRLAPTSPLERTRLMVSTWIAPTERGLEIPATMRRLHHLAVSLDVLDSPEAVAIQSGRSIWPAPPTVTWHALDDLDHVAREQVSLDTVLWEGLDPDGAQPRLGSTRSAIAEHAARILAALDGRNHVAQTDLQRAAKWARLPEEL